MQTRRRMFYRATLASLLLLLLPSAHATEIELNVTTDREQIYLGESFMLTIKVAGIDDAPAPDLAALTACDIEFLGSRGDNRYSIVIVNGRMHKESFSGRVFTYRITPRQAGVFKAGPVTLSVDGETYRDTGPQVRVSGVTEQEWVEIEVAATKETVLIDEPFEVTLRIRIKALDGRYDDVDPLDPENPPQLDVPFLNPDGIDGLDGPDVRALLQRLLVQRGEQPGFAINAFTVRKDPFRDPFAFSSFFDAEKARFALERQPCAIDGERYHQYTLSLIYVPREERSYTFGPVTFKGLVITAVAADGRPAGKHIFAVGPAATVRVVPPPEAGRPPEYIGAIGTNLLVSASLDTRTCNVGDPLTLSLLVTGQVSLDNMHPPLLNAQERLREHFRVYEDTVETIEHDHAREYRYTVRPRHAGTIEFPPVRVAYFDTRTRAYRTVASEPLPVRVNQTVQIANDMIINAATNGSAAQATPGVSRGAPPVAAIVVNAPGRRDRGLAPRAWHWSAVCLPPLLYGLLLGAVAFQRRVRRGAPERRRRGAAHRAMAAIGAATAADGIRQALREYAADRFGAHAGSLTPGDIRLIMTRHGVPRETADAYASLLTALFEAAYAPGAQAGSTDNAAGQAIALIERVEHEGGGSR